MVNGSWKERPCYRKAIILSRAVTYALVYLGNLSLFSLFQNFITGFEPPKDRSTFKWLCRHSNSHLIVQIINYVMKSVTRY